MGVTYEILDYFFYGVYIWMWIAINRAKIWDLKLVYVFTNVDFKEYYLVFICNVEDGLSLISSYFYKWEIRSSLNTYIYIYILQTYINGMQGDIWHSKDNPCYQGNHALHMVHIYFTLRATSHTSQ